MWMANPAAQNSVSLSPGITCLSLLVHRLAACRHGVAAERRLLRSDTRCTLCPSHERRSCSQIPTVGGSIRARWFENSVGLSLYHRSRCSSHDEETPHEGGLVSVNLAPGLQPKRRFGPTDSCHLASRWCWCDPIHTDRSTGHSLAVASILLKIRKLRSLRR